MGTTGARMDDINRLVTMRLDAGRYALPLVQVQRVIHAIAITPLPKAPQIITGIINMQGQVIPVVDMRRRFSLPERDIALDDHMVIARTSRRDVVLVVDAVEEVIGLPADAIIAGEMILPELEYVDGVIKLEDGLVLIHDLDRLLSLDEETALVEALP